MIVQVATLDILTQRAHLDPEVARAIGDAIAMEVDLAREPLATRQELEQSRSELRVEMSALRAEIAGFRCDVKNEIAGLRTLIQETRADVARWMLGGFISFFIALLGSIYFTLQHVR